jgi:predicted TIM-barrel fold metal-dependent hydrolase
MWNPARCLEEFLELDLSETERELILHGNAGRIIPDAYSQFSDRMNPV